MKSSRELVFRPGGTPSANIPLGARSVGHYRLVRPYAEAPVVKHFVQAFWGVAGRGIFVINGEERLLNPGECAVYLPGMEHNLRIAGDAWEYRWWTMDGPLAGELAKQFGITADIFKVGPAPVQLFDQLRAAIQDISPSGERTASVLAYQMLARISPSAQSIPSDPVISQVLRMIHRKCADPALGVDSVARTLHLHRSTLSRQFKRIVGMPPVEYIVKLRVQNAMSLLKTSAMSIAEISRQCGYDNPNYFCRLIQTRTGQSPRQFRRR